MPTAMSRQALILRENIKQNEKNGIPFPLRGRKGIFGSMPDIPA